MRELPEETLYDTRLIERHIKEGLISEEDVKKRLEALDDGEVIFAWNLNGVAFNPTLCQDMC